MRSLVRGAAMLALACSLAVSGGAFAQVYPNKLIRSIVPFTAGASYNTKQHIPAGRIRAYAVAAKKRSQHLPELPTTAEAGLPGCEASQWYSVFAPSATPPRVLARLEEELRRATARPDVKSRLAAQGADTHSETPKELAAFIREDVRINRETARAAGIKMN